MSFYVWDTPEVSKHFNSTYYSEDHYYVVTGNRLDDWFKNDSRDYVGKALINQLKREGIPEYKLHPIHGLIPANSKLFNEDTNKEQKEKLMKQPVKKVFEVGDKCVIRNPSNYEVMEEVKKYFIDKECKIVAKFKLSIPMVVVELDVPETSDMFGVCVVFREEMCYPVKTEKEKAIEEIVDIVCSQGFPTKEGTASWAIASELYKAGYRKVGE
ncbi:hypothetical protein phiA019_0046 [Aeromonas phage phiA019]|nr:hypothetical protein phiA009_0050 [Aeromonas phage phiA009]ULG01583.1 hypothetical protein phiA019_0046 [Aeromonas phage phiA019]